VNSEIKGFAFLSAILVGREELSVDWWGWLAEVIGVGIYIYHYVENRLVLHRAFGARKGIPSLLFLETGAIHYEPLGYLIPETRALALVWK
jgi:hypothetical protein